MSQDDGELLRIVNGVFRFPIVDEYVLSVPRSMLSAPSISASPPSWPLIAYKISTQIRSDARFGAQVTCMFTLDVMIVGDGRHQQLLCQPMSTLERRDELVRYLKQLAEAGFRDVHTLRRDTAERVITEKRTELIEAIASGDIESIRDLARRVDRNPSIVSRDLDVLFEAGIVEFEADGRAKRPVLAHENVFVMPVVFDGSVLSEEPQEPNEG